MKKQLKVGQTINIRIQKGIKKSNEDWKVYQLYDRFAVLTNGKYKMCAFYKDMQRGVPVLAYI